MQCCHIVCRGVRRNLDGGSGRVDGCGELRYELHHITRRDIGCSRCHGQTGDSLRHNLDGSTRVGGEQRARGERRHAVNTPMVEIHRVRERLRIIELGSAIKGVTRLIPISGHKQRHRAGDTKVWNLNDAIWHVGLIQLKHR